MADQNAKADRALFRYYYGTAEPSWAAAFHHLSRDERMAFRVHLQQPGFSLPEGCSEEFAARWLVALDIVDLMSDPVATLQATTEAESLLRRASQVGLS